MNNKIRNAVEKLKEKIKNDYGRYDDVLVIYSDDSIIIDFVIISGTDFFFLRFYYDDNKTIDQIYISKETVIYPLKSIN